MPLTKPSRPPSRFTTLLSIVVVIAVLRIAEEVTIPLALSLLLAFLLSPLVVRLTRWMPKTLAITVTVVLAFTIVAAATWQISNSVISLLQELPQYESNVRQKVEALGKPGATGSWNRTLRTIERMQADLFKPFAGPAQPAADGKAVPVPVEVRPANQGPLDFTKQVLGRLLGPISTASVVVVFVIAILFQREDLRNRFIRVVSGGQLNIATQAVDDAAQRVSRYLVAQLMVNLCFGLCIGGGLALIGVPHPALWGLLATVLRFIPFLGPVIAAAFPLLLAIAVDPGWSMLTWTALLFVAAELITNNIVEVWVYGTSTGISTLALLTAAVFWSWLWGLPGLFLSTPLTVCLLVVGQYVPGLKFLGVLLGSEPPLDPAAQFYQRMLSMQQEDLFAAAEAYVEQHSLAAFYDDVFVPALYMAEVDRHNGVLAEVRQKFIFESGTELIDDLRERSEAAPQELGPAAPPTPEQRAIVGLPARDEADQLVANMLAHLLQQNGLRCRVIAVTTAPEQVTEEVRNAGGAVFVSALPPSTVSAAGRVCRRVKQLSKNTKVLVGVWGAEPSPVDAPGRLRSAGADAVASRLADAVVQLKSLLEAKPEPARQPTPETKTTRVLEHAETKLSAARPEEAIDTLVREAARAFSVPSALVSVIETDASFWRKPPRQESATPFPESRGLDDVLATDEFVAVEDVEKDPRYAAQPELTKRGVRFFATVPLRTQDGRRVGNLYVLDTQPRALRDGDRDLLQSLAHQLTEALEVAAAK